MFWLLACTGGDADRYAAYVLRDDGHAVQARSIDTLSDAQRLQGQLGTGFAGGVMSVDLQTFEVAYEPGRDLDVQYVVVDGVAQPLDRDGLILFSFYGHMQDARDALLAAGIDISPLFPVDIAITPALPDIGFAFAPVDNAAYMPGANAFLIFDDTGDRSVPLAANAGVVIHELGHGVFHLWTAGGPYQESGFSPEGAAAPGVASLHEGHSDMLAALITGDPDFISDSLALPERDVSGDHTTAGVAVLPEDYDPSSASWFEGYDPYALGTVFAAVIWDVYEVTGDRDAMLVWVSETSQVWAEREIPAQESLSEEDRRTTAYRWLDVLVERGDTQQSAAACDSIAVRFHVEVPGC